MDFELEARPPAEAVRLFLGARTGLRGVRVCWAPAPRAAEDGRFGADERRQLEPLLLGLMKASWRTSQSIRGV